MRPQIQRELELITAYGILYRDCMIQWTKADEEVEDEGEQGPWTYEHFPEKVALSSGLGIPAFHHVRDEQESMKEGRYAPFKDQDEWELVKWLMRRTTQGGIEEYLKMKIVSWSKFMHYNMRLDVKECMCGIDP